MLSAYGSNFGSMFIILDEFENAAIAEAVQPMPSRRAAQEVRRGHARGAGERVRRPGRSAAGPGRRLPIMVEDRGDVGPDVLQGQTENLVEEANQQKQLVGLFTVFKANSPQLFVDVDRGACLVQRARPRRRVRHAAGYLGCRYVNDFNRFGRTWQVIVQAEPTVPRPGRRRASG